jgi:hypothetical protein
LPLNRDAAASARVIAPAAASSSRLAAGVNTFPSHTPTTTAPERGKSGSVKLIFIGRPR